MADASNLHVLEQGKIQLVVDLALGARIVEFSWDGKNTLATTGPQTGSTFWPSPQSTWDWPPPAVLDSESYELIEANEKRISSVSAACDITNLQLTKNFELIDGGVRVTYIMKNVGEEAVKFAAWEISRIYGGLTFYASESPSLSHSSLAVEAEAGCQWHDYKPAGFDQNLKLFANNSEGWLANVYEGLLLVKRFDRVEESRVAPGEAEVEIYAHGDPDNAYIEIEQQGEYREIMPGESSSWTVDWLLAECDSNIEVTPGNPELINLVKTRLS